MDNIISKLDELAEIQSALDFFNLEYEDQRKKILAKVQDELDSLDSEYQPRISAASENAITLTDEIKALVVASGSSAKGARLSAVYNKGRVTWDTKGLDGYSVAHPELAAFRKVGEPSVTIRVR